MGSPEKALPAMNICSIFFIIHGSSTETKSSPEEMMIHSYRRKERDNIVPHKETKERFTRLRLSFTSKAQ